MTTIPFKHPLLQLVSDNSAARGRSRRTGVRSRPGNSSAEDRRTEVPGPPTPDLAGGAPAHPAGRRRAGNDLESLFASARPARPALALVDDSWVHARWDAEGTQAPRRERLHRRDAVSGKRSRAAGAPTSEREPHERQAGDRGAVTAEYVVLIVAAVAFAGLLVAILRSGEIRAMLLELVQNALGSAG